MNLLAYEGIIENGQIRLKSKVRLPNKAKVYIILPDYHSEKGSRVFSPRLANPAQLPDFKMEVTEDSNNVDL
ncbi:MAG: hypothetical protein ACE5I1_09670 [bacterium]